MAARVKLGGKNKDDFDLMFELSNVKVFVIANPEMYNDEDVAKIEEIVKTMSRKIFIDKSYVDFPENKHRDTFLELEGWESVCKLVKRTKYGKITTDAADSLLHEAFKTIALAYLYDVLEKFGYDIENITLDVLNDTGIAVRFYKDTIQEWKYYPGPWQDWGIDDSEQQ